MLHPARKQRAYPISLPEAAKALGTHTPVLSMVLRGIHYSPKVWEAYKNLCLKRGLTPPPTPKMREYSEG